MKTIPLKVKHPSVNGTIRLTDYSGVQSSPEELLLNCISLGGIADGVTLKIRMQILHSRRTQSQFSQFTAIISGLFF